METPFNIWLNFSLEQKCMVNAVAPYLQHGMRESPGANSKGKCVQ